MRPGDGQTDHHPLVARHAQRARRGRQGNDQGIQRLPGQIRGGGHQQGQLRRNRQRRHRRHPGRQAAPHPAVLRGRYADHDALGGHLPGLQAHGRHGLQGQLERLSPAGAVLLRKRRRPPDVHALQLLDAGHVLQRGHVQEDRHRPPVQDRAHHLGPAGRNLRQTGQGRRTRRHGDRLAVMDPDRELQRHPEPALRHQGQRLRRAGLRTDHQQRQGRAPHRPAQVVDEG